MNVVKRSEYCNGVSVNDGVPYVKASTIKRGTMFSGKPLGVIYGGVFFKTGGGFTRISYNAKDNVSHCVEVGYNFNDDNEIADYKVLNATLVIDD